MKCSAVGSTYIHRAGGGPAGGYTRGIQVGRPHAHPFKAPPPIPARKGKKRAGKLKRHQRIALEREQREREREREAWWLKHRPYD